jgi:hypothetical protein
MPEFVLNRPHWWPSAAPDDDADLRYFACAYVEAMFFTNGDCGDEDDDSLNSLGAERLTKGAKLKIVYDCDRFLSWGVRKLITASPGDFEQAGHDFWLTRQGHGEGFWSRDDDVWPERARDYLDARAKGFGEAHVYRQGGWIYVE